MDSQTKRTITATLACLLFLLVWFRIQHAIYPPPPAPTSAAAASAPAQPTVTQEPNQARAPITPPAMASPAASAYQATSSPLAETITLGDDRHEDDRLGVKNPFEFAITFSPRGAAVEAIRLSRYRNHVPKDPRRPDHDPYDLVRPVEDAAEEALLTSFVTERLLIADEKESVDLADIVWSQRHGGRDGGQFVEFQTTLRRDDRDAFRLTKTYAIEPGSVNLEIDLQAENLTARPARLIVTQRGPLGFANDDPQREFRRVLTAVIDDAGVIANGPVLMHDAVFKSEGGVADLPPPPDRHTYWTATGNKYFACIVFPQPQGNDRYARWLAKTQARTYLQDAHRAEDLCLEYTLAPPDPIAPGATTRMRFEVYCGPKSDARFEELEYAKKRRYELVSHPDRSGCTFDSIQVVMLWLLTRIHSLVGNYGIAIIVLVLIVRLILHPVTKNGQVNMMKMQKGMARLKPKMELIQQQYKNDRQKLNEEMMKLYREEGINPASQMLGCLPMFLQMPIWVALWTTLNTNVELRHARFFGWINDLSAPDALIPLPPSWHFSIPLIGAMMGGAIKAFNLLPIIMTITMYAQQKFTQKLTQPATPTPPKVDAQGRPLPDPMAQQQKMMTWMMLFFGLLFYNFPSGLNLYILSSNLIGMLEQYRIRKHIREKEERGELLPAARASTDAPRSPGFFGRLQEKAEQAKQAQSGRLKPKKRRKEPRF